MAPEPERIYNVCDALLTAVVTHHGGTLPARQYVSAGAPAWDCDLIAVWHETADGYEGDPVSISTQTMPAGPGFAMRAGTFVITMVRKTCAVPRSQGNRAILPTVEQEEDAARVLYGDEQRMVNAIVAAAKAGELTGCRSLAILGWQVIGPEGEYVAGELRVRIGLVLGA